MAEKIKCEYCEASTAKGGATAAHMAKHARNGDLSESEMRHRHRTGRKAGGEEIPAGGWRAKEPLVASKQEENFKKLLTFNKKTGELVMGKSEEEDSVVVEQIYKDGFFTDPQLQNIAA